MVGSRSLTAVPETLYAGRSKVEGWGGWRGLLMARCARDGRHVRHRCRAAAGLTLRDGLTFVETTIRLLLADAGQ